MSQYVVRTSPSFRAVTVNGRTTVQASPVARGPAGTHGARGPAGPGVDEAVGRVLNRRPFTKLLRDLSVNGKAVVVIEGDSKASGVGAESLPNRWQEKLLALARTAHASSGDAGVGFVPWHMAANDGGFGPGTPRASIGGTRNDSATADWSYLSDGGPGWQGVQLDTATAVVTVVPLSVRYLSVEFTKRNDLYAGTFEVRSNGSLIGTINTATGATGTPTSAWWHHDFGSVAARTITLTRTAGRPRTSGAMFRTADAGLSFIDAAHSGGMAENYLSHPLSVTAVQGFSTVPSLLICALGSNDLQTSSWEDMATNLKAHFEQHWAINPDMGVLFVMSPPRPQNVDPSSGEYDPSRWGEVFAEINALIGDDPRVAIWSEATIFTPSPVSGAGRDPWDLTVFNDGVHWGPLANDLIAQSLMRDCFSMASAVGGGGGGGVTFDDLENGYTDADGGSLSDLLNGYSTLT